MSELRYDPLSGHWVTIASIRAERPNEFRRLETRNPDAVCPFCAGQESQTPRPLLALGAHSLAQSDTLEHPDSVTDWLVRVVPNKYPAYSPTGPLAPASYGPYTSLHGEGSHEIVIESPRHVISLPQLTDDELRATFRAYQWRIRAALEQDLVRQIILFKNCRPEAGASIEHVHSQLIASPVASPSATSRFERCARAFFDSGRSLLTAMVCWEEQGPRTIETRGEFVAFCPYASRLAFQVWIAPREPVGPFEELSPAGLDQLAQLVRSVVGRLEASLDHPPYNMILHLPPKLNSDVPAHEIFPWFIELIPRIGRLAGFELAGGGWILDCPPEIAAARIRGEMA